MTGMLVSGYDSDSGSDDAVSAKSSLGSILPPPKASGSGLSLPPPKAAPKRAKFQIKVDALDVPSDEEAPQPKKVKPNMQKPASSHSLFGMLPAPKRAEDIVKEEKEKEAQQAREGALKIVEQPVVAEEEDQEKPKRAKGNDAFRAMLGLKPTAPSKYSAPKAGPSKMPAPAQSEPIIQEPAVPEPEEPSMATPVDFFSLGGTETKVASSSSSEEAKRGTFSISSAPIIDEPPAPEEEEVSANEPEAYPGWQQDPDGTWVPVTPEAHAQYAAWQASAPVPRGFEMPATAVVREVDANAVSYRPGGIDTTDDSKYAQAAAQIKAGIAGPVQGDNGGRLVSAHAKRRGQLSALLVEAKVKGEKLEEKWAQGREKRQQASARYGF